MPVALQVAHLQPGLPHRRPRDSSMFAVVGRLTDLQVLARLSSLRVSEAFEVKAQARCPPAAEADERCYRRKPE